jgi:hypothetical protein
MTTPQGMTKTPKSPQDKKRLSLAKDRRNSYGENAKSSRKNIPRSKAISRRKVRHAAKAQTNTLAGLSEEHSGVVQSTLTKARLQKGPWKKCPDRPLGAVVADKLKTRAATVGAKKRRRAKRAGR